MVKLTTVRTVPQVDVNKMRHVNSKYPNYTDGRL